tara:strand:- start:204 stop:440 length:237 start_codon:yes stop_codon:yes gene_type:complete
VSKKSEYGTPAICPDSPHLDEKHDLGPASTCLRLIKRFSHVSLKKNHLSGKCISYHYKLLKKMPQDKKSKVRVDGFFF